MATQTLENTNSWSLWKFTIGGVIAGILSGIINNLYIVVFPLITPFEAPRGIDSMSVTILSFLPMLLAAFVYYAMYSFSQSTGTRNYIIMGITGLVLSMYGPLFPDSLNATLEAVGMSYSFQVTEGFAFFLIPMHLITAIMALYIIPKFVTSD